MQLPALAKALQVWWYWLLVDICHSLDRRHSSLPAIHYYCPPSAACLLSPTICSRLEYYYCVVVHFFLHVTNNIPFLQTKIQLHYYYTYYIYIHTTTNCSNQNPTLTNCDFNRRYSLHYFHSSFYRFIILLSSTMIMSKLQHRKDNCCCLFWCSGCLQRQAK